MRRWAAAALAAWIGLFLLAGAAEAGGRFRRHHRRHRATRFVFHFGAFYPLYRPRYVYRPYYYAYPAPCCPGYAYPTLGEREALGAVLGGIGGAVIGSQIGGGGGRVVSAAVGSILGVLAGGEIGRQLDEAHRIRMARATQYALEKARSGSQVGWRDPDTGVAGSVVPRPAWKNRLGQYCREFQQTVIIGGQEQSAYGTACRQPDGQWEIVN